MRRVIAVVLDGADWPLGDLRYDRQGRRESAAFAYSERWLADKQRFAVDPNLPLVNGFQFHARGPGGSLADAFDGL